MKRRLRILSDVDNTLNYMWRKTAETANKRFGDTWNPDSLEGQTTWNINEVSNGGEDFYSIWDQPGFFRDVDVMPGALDVLPRLYEQGHEIYLVTATNLRNRDAGAVYDKVEWMMEHFPFIKERNIIICHDKFTVEGDVLFDDNSDRNLKNWKAAHPEGLAVALAAGYNKEWNIRVKDWWQFEALLKVWMNSNDNQDVASTISGLMMKGDLSPAQIMSI